VIVSIATAVCLLVYLFVPREKDSAHRA
jgi:hypothetical protein